MPNIVGLGDSQNPSRLRENDATGVNGISITAEFILEAADGESPSANPDYVSEAFKETMNFWLGWVAKSKYQGRWREMVNRSALTLKLLTSRPHGSIVAAPTFGLPEKNGGALNWDYRCVGFATRRSHCMR